MAEKEELRELKRKAVDELKGIDLHKYRLNKTDDRLNTYINEVSSNPEKHNLYELLSVIRFFRLMDTYLFKTNEVKKFVAFYESLQFSGLSGRTMYKLTPIQVFQFANILGFYKTEEKRLIRDALLFVPRKYSKTTSVASLAIYDLLFGDANAQSYVAANNYNQAQICFSEIKEILKCLDPKFRHFKINREQVFILCTGSFCAFCGRNEVNEIAVYRTVCHPERSRRISSLYVYTRKVDSSTSLRMTDSP